MGIFSGLFGGNDYNSLKGGNRTPLRTRTGISEAHLGGSAKKKAIGNTRDLRRNFAVAAWGIRKHLDYVSDFKFKAKGDDDELKQYLSRKVRQWSTKRNFDQSGRFSLSKGLRLLEASRFVDGDVFAYKLRNGRLQFIEADRVKTITKQGDKEYKNKSWIEGMLVDDKSQRIEKIRVGQRTTYGNLEFLADVNYKDILPLAYVERFDQWRGISPLLSGMSIFQDQAEASDYALAKLKISQLFGIAFYRDGDESLGLATNNGTSLDDILDPNDIEKNGYDVDLGKGPLQLDLDPGDRAEFLESQNPSNQAQDYMLMMIEMALKTLDFPVNFYDESKANFAGSRGAMINYRKSTLSKKADLREWLNDWFMWKVRTEILNGDVYLAENIDNINFEWVASGFEWWDTLKQAKGAREMIAMGLDNPQRIAKETDTDFYENIDSIAEAQKYAESKGVSLNLGLIEEPQEETALEEMPEQEDRK